MNGERAALLESRPEARGMVPVARLQAGAGSGAHIRSVVGPESVCLLLLELPAFETSATCDEVYDYFAAHLHVQSLAVVESGRPQGLVNRHKLTDQFSRRYFREIYGRRSITSIMDTAPLVVEEAMSIDAVAQIIVDEQDRFLYEGFIITQRGVYLGMGTGHALLREVSERKQAYLHHMAYHDGLTGMPNRQLFYDRLGQAIREAQRTDHQLAVLYVDLDRFKGVNDTLGHAAGDQLLVQASQRLRGCLRDADTLARLGGDEFGVVLADLVRGTDAAVVGERMRTASAEPFLLAEAQSVQVSASIGISLFPGDGRTVEALVRCADSALYHSKIDRNRYSFYAQSMDEPVEQEAGRPSAASSQVLASSARSL